MTTPQLLGLPGRQRVHRDVVLPVVKRQDQMMPYVSSVRVNVTLDH